MGGSFSGCLREVFRAPRPFMARYGANVAGFFWNAGTALQFVFGLIVWSPLEITSSVFNIIAPCVYMLFGHRNAGIIAGGSLGIIGTFLAVYPQIVDGEIGTIFGFLAFVCFVLINMFGVQLTRRFGRSENPLMRATFGQPRRLAGLGPFLCTRVPIVTECLIHQRWHLATVFAVWGLGDIALSLSKPRMP